MSRKFLIVLCLLVGIAAGAAGASWLILRRNDGASSVPAASAVRLWHCPMHPSIRSDKPGECPICQMSLVPAQEDDSNAGGVDTGGTGKRVVYHSTMNPNEVSDKPGKDSMGMEMVAEEVVDAPAGGGPAVEGLAPVRIPAARQQLIGMTTAAVERVPFRRTIRAVGRIAYDETRLRHIHTKIGGYVERLYANAIGETVRAGEPLLEIYSPELLASQQEYLVALKARARTAGSSLPSVAGSGEELAASARRRLELFDLTPGQIEDLERTRQASRTMTLHAPISGTVLERMVTQGQKVEPEMTLLDLVDLSRVWVLASVYEYELPFVRQGQPARMTLSYLPGRSFEGRIALVYPTLDATTRTVLVRVEFANPDLQLKPDMYAEVELESDLGERLSVPETAVMETGERSVVFVDRGEGRFDPREVHVGLRLPDRYEILDGLAEGERVITSANFYVDSESKLKAALAQAAERPAPGGGEATTPAASPETPPAGHPH